MKSKRRDIHQGKIIQLVTDTIECNDGTMKTFDVVLHPGAVAIIPIDEKGDLLLVKQWRRAADKTLIEIPAGTLEEGEEPAVCAQRELREETGFRADEWTSLGGFFTAPGFCNEYIHLFIAKQLAFDPLVGDDTDEIDVVKFSLGQALEMVESGEIDDAKTILGILWLLKQKD